MQALRSSCRETAAVVWMLRNLLRLWLAHKTVDLQMFCPFLGPTSSSIRVWQPQNTWCVAHSASACRRAPSKCQAFHVLVLVLPGQAHHIWQVGLGRPRYFPETCHTSSLAHAAQTSDGCQAIFKWDFSHRERPFIHFDSFKRNNSLIDHALSTWQAQALLCLACSPTTSSMNGAQMPG